MERIEIELDVKEYSFKMGAEEMILREPYLEETFIFEKELVAIEPSEVEKMVVHYRAYLTSLGGKEEILKKLSLRNIVQIMDVLKGKKN